MAKPIVKWAGGKHRLIGELQKYLPETIDTYVEPFAGGAALFFALASDERGPRFRRAILADRNEELVACYRAVKHDVEAVIDALGVYKYDRDLYYQTRDLETEAMSDVERAARLIFLNHTCFNGLWRVNASGRFNVPFGRYSNPRILDADGLREASRALAWAEILHVDFAAATKKLRGGDFVYFDPPYVPVSATANFTAYAKDGFGPDDQERLAKELRRLRDRGVGVLLSNHDTPEAQALYADFAMHVVHVKRPINSDTSKRGEARELLVTSLGEPGVHESSPPPKSSRPVTRARAPRAAPKVAARRSRKVGA